MLRDNSGSAEQFPETFLIIGRRAPGQSAARTDLLWKRDQPPLYTMPDAVILKRHGIMG